MKRIYALLAALFIALMGLAAAPSSGAAQEGMFSDAQREEIGRIVRDYLIANPQVLEEVLVALEEHQAQAQLLGQRTALAENRDRIFDSPNAFVAGNPEGDVTLVEFFDYNCGYCKRMLPAIVDLVNTDPNLRVVFKEWPVLGEDSAGAARVAVAVKEQAPERYFDFHVALLAERGRIDAARALDLAAEMGMDRSAIESGAQAPSVEATLVESLELGNVLGLRGTPTYVLGDEVLMGAVGFDTLKQKIAQVRENGCETC